MGVPKIGANDGIFDRDVGEVGGLLGIFSNLDIPGSSRALERDGVLVDLEDHDGFVDLATRSFSMVFLVLNSSRLLLPILKVFEVSKFPGCELTSRFFGSVGYRASRKKILGSSFQEEITSMRHERDPTAGI